MSNVIILSLCQMPDDFTCQNSLVLPLNDFNQTIYQCVLFIIKWQWNLMSPILSFLLCLMLEDCILVKVLPLNVLFKQSSGNMTGYQLGLMMDRASLTF